MISYLFLIVHIEKINLLSRAEMKKVMGGNVPAGDI